MHLKLILSAVIATSLLTSCSSMPVVDAPRNVIFFIGGGLGLNTMTAARIYAVGEEGDLTLDTLPDVAFVKTYSNNAQVTDSAAAMSAYMTGMKVNNEVISMSADTRAVKPAANGSSACGSGNGKPVATLLELAAQNGRATGVVTTTRVTQATPAATYAHTCHRDLESDIAVMLAPGGAGYNHALGSGLDVVLGGGTDYFLPSARGGKRADGRDLLAEMKSGGYAYTATAAQFRALDARRIQRLLGLFSPSHMAYDLDRDVSKEPSLAEMTVKAMEVLARNRKGYFLMVDGGRIDHALHETLARKALQDVVAFDAALKAAIAKARETDPELKNTLIVATADHDHTLHLNGYAQRTGKTTPSNPGVLGLVKRYSNGALAKDLDGAPYTIIGFGTGEHRLNASRAQLARLDQSTVAAATYHQEAVVQTSADRETHGGADVFLGAIGRGAESFRGTIENTRVFELVRAAAGL